MDGAGPGSAIASSMLMLSSMNIEEETENNVKRVVVDKDGLKVLEDFEKDGSRSKIQFVSNNRYIIELEESIWE